MAGGLVALLDDIATLARAAAASVDDVAAAAGKASAKAAGVVVDDTAVTPQYLDGLKPERELPIIKRITLGSLRNKLIIILPIALLLSQFAPWLLPIILMLGGSYLVFEGMEKVWEKFSPSPVSEEPKLAQGANAEDQVVKSAVTTDLILSAEIMVIALNEVAQEGIWARTIILIIVGFGITFLVYGVVALLVKMDDIGLSLMKRDSEGVQKFGSALVKAMPKVLTAIGVIGTLAMLWVGGHIIVTSLAELGFTLPADLIHLAENFVSQISLMGGFLAWTVNTTLSLMLGIVIGFILVGIVHLVRYLRGSKSEADAA
ncbi:MAG: DUF808 domain-containing protein [Actinomycetaceae bacterium]|nr:DUF808 domain-containing protein [Actinomycetaceae bacterium]